MIQTNEGALQHEFTLNHHLEFFSKAGSLFTNKQPFYNNNESALSLFQKAWVVDQLTAFKLLLWLRDCRGGAGNRSAFRECLNWLAEENTDNGRDWIFYNIHWIPMAGRWDDLKSLFNTPLEAVAAKLWASALKEGDVLAAKWCDRKNFPVKHMMQFQKEGDFRKFLAAIRQDKIVEHKMSQKDWHMIQYNTVPSIAMARYTKAFAKNDPYRFADYKESLASGKTTINASVLFPHDCVRTARSGDGSIANAQFDAMPNYLEGVDERIIVLSDTSGSMDTTVCGSIRAADVSQGLALYCSEKIGADSPFYKKFIGFCSEGKFKDWNGKTFSQAVNDHQLFDGAVGSTRIGNALELILNTATFYNVEAAKMPTTLLIVSDMQFTSATSTDGDWYFQGRKKITTLPVESVLLKWEKAGYQRPKIVYWNTDGYAGAPDTKDAKNVALVSGFSPSILKSIFSGDDFSPMAIMNRAIEKYEVKIPG